MNKEEKIFEWLMHNNFLYAELHSRTDIKSKSTLSSLSEKQEQEVGEIFNHRSNLNRTAYHIFSGEVCYLENSSFIDKDIIKENRKSIKDWMLRHIFTVTKDGIIFSDECKSKDRSYINNGLEYDNTRIYFPDLPESYFKEKDKKRNCAIRLIKDCNVYSDLVFKPNTYSASYDTLADSLLGAFIIEEKTTKKDLTAKINSGKSKSLTYKSLLNEQGELRYKIKECQDLYIDMEHIYYRPLANFTSLKNFPDIVHGNLVFIDWDNIISLEGFPMLCENEVIFRTCRIPYNVKLQEGVIINSNLVCIDCVNDYNLLIGILKYNWHITGTIYTSLFTGTLNELREIATKEEWI